MKKIINKNKIIISILFLNIMQTANLFAQSEQSYLDKKSIEKYNKFETYTYQIENSYFIASIGCKPNTTVNYFSDQSGISNVKNSNSDKNGFIVSQFNETNPIGLVSNKGMLSFTTDKEFVLKNIHFEKENNIVNFFSNGFANEDNIELNILKSIDGKTFKAIKSITIPKQQSLSSINFQDEYNNVAVYKIEVVKNKTKQRYLSPAYSFKNKSDVFDVFPTISKDEVHVNFQTIDKPIEYQIVNSQGQMQLKGVFDKNFNSINISLFANGIYYVVLNIDNQLFTTKINKQ